MKGLQLYTGKLLAADTLSKQVQLLKWNSIIRSFYVQPIKPFHRVAQRVGIKRLFVELISYNLTIDYTFDRFIKNQAVKQTYNIVKKNTSEATRLVIRLSGRQITDKL